MNFASCATRFTSKFLDKSSHHGWLMRCCQVKLYPVFSFATEKAAGKTKMSKKSKTENLTYNNQYGKIKNKEMERSEKLEMIKTVNVIFLRNVEQSLCVLK